MRMKTALGLILTLVILLACCSSKASAFQVQELSQTLPHSHFQTNPKKNGDFYCPWFYKLQWNGPPRYGWLVNGTIM